MVRAACEPVRSPRRRLALAAVLPPRRLVAGDRGPPPARARPCPSCPRWPSRSTASTTTTAAWSRATARSTARCGPTRSTQALSHGPATETRHLAGLRRLPLAGAGHRRPVPTVLADPSRWLDHGAFEAQRPGPQRGHGRSSTRSRSPPACSTADGAELAGSPSPARSTTCGRASPCRSPSPPTCRPPRWPRRVVGRRRCRAGDETARALAWTPYWERPAGRRARSTSTSTATRWASARTPSSARSPPSVTEPASAPEVVVAWLDAAGRHRPHPDRSRGRPRRCGARRARRR